LFVHRVQSVASLAFASGAGALFVVALARGILALLGPLLLAITAGWFGWRAVTRRGSRRVAYAVGGALATAATIVTVALFTRQLPIVIAAAAMLVASAVSAGSALAWIHTPGGRLVGPARHPVLIVNPRSGDGAAQRSNLVAVARERGIRVIELRAEDDLEALARGAVHGGTDVLGMAGGDGSLAVVASIAMDARIPFVCVPSGTRNHFALDLGLDRNDPIGALDAFGEAVQRKIDVGMVNGRRFLNNVSVGAYGEAVASADYRDNKVGVALDTLPTLIGPDAEPTDLRFVDHDGARHTSAVVLHVSNNSYDLSPNLGFGSRPSLVDGCLGVVAIVAEDGSGPPQVLSWTTEEFVVSSGELISAGIDGEASDLQPPLSFSIEPLALRVRMSRDALGVSPAAKRPSLTARTFLRLLAVAGGKFPAADLAGDGPAIRR